MSPESAIHKDAIEQNQLPDETLPYELVRPACPSDTLHKVLNELGLFSNIIALASYHQPNDQPLNRTRLFQALQLVINQHPNLSNILVSQPSPDGKDSHQVWKARLKSIDLEKCVSFIDGYDDSESGLRRLLQKAHNTWFNTEDKTLPLWNLIVVNHTHVLFALHHSVADGIGGTAFHSALLAALNSVSKPSPASSVTPSPDNELPDDNIVIFSSQNRKASILRIILSCIYLLILRTLLPRKYWFFSSATYSMAVPPFTARGHAENRTKTKVQSLRLDHSILSKCLSACKKNNTTFTSLLATLIDVTLATDIYPNSKLRILATQVDCRRYAKQEDNIMNLASTISQTSFVSQYRKAGIAPISTNSSESSPLLGIKLIDCQLFWKLARKYNEWLKDGLSEANGKTPIPVQDFMVMSSFRKEEEAFAKQILPSIGLTTERAWSLSNLGVFDGQVTEGEEVEGPWRIGNVEFSVASTKSCVGYMLYFGVVSLRRGDCVIHVTYNEGALEDEMVLRMLGSMEQRLGYLLESA
ncbi:Alcohol acetyltransferase [Hyaloscypha variabilis]